MSDISSWHRFIPSSGHVIVGCENVRQKLFGDIVPLFRDHTGTDTVLSFS